MEVLCIDDKERPGDYPSTPMVVKGCVYHPTRICRGYGPDGSVALSFKLAEFDQKYCWDCDRFIPINDISEEEMMRYHEQKELVEIEIL